MSYCDCEDVGSIPIYHPFRRLMIHYVKHGHNLILFFILKLFAVGSSPFVFKNYRFFSYYYQIAHILFYSCLSFKFTKIKKMIFKFNLYKILELIKVLISNLYSTIVYFLGSLLFIYLGADHSLKFILYVLKIIKSNKILE